MFNFLKRINQNLSDSFTVLIPIKLSQIIVAYIFRKNSKFLVTAREREPSEIARLDEYHEMEDITLYVCKNCLKNINY